MVPVDEGVVEPYPQALGPESVHIGQDSNPGRQGCCTLVIGVLGVKQAEALVMLGRHDGVFHPGGFGHLCPLGRIVQIRVKVAEIPVIGFVGHTLPGLYPLVPGGHGIQAKVMNMPNRSRINQAVSPGVFLVM